MKRLGRTIILSLAILTGAAELRASVEPAGQVLPNLTIARKPPARERKTISLGFSAYLRQSAKTFSNTLVLSVAQAQRKVIIVRRAPNKPTNSISRLAVNQKSTERTMATTLPFRLTIACHSSEDSGRAVYWRAEKASFAENTASQGVTGRCFSIAASIMPSGSGNALFSGPHASGMGRSALGMSDTCGFTTSARQRTQRPLPLTGSCRQSPAPNLRQVSPLLSRNGAAIAVSTAGQIPVKAAPLVQQAPKAASNAINPPCSLLVFSAAAAPGAVLPESL